MNVKVDEPTIVIIVGISGDLAKRKLLPAIHNIDTAGLLPDKFRIVGVSRRELTKAEVLPAKGVGAVGEKLEMYCMDLTQVADYHKLAQHLDTIEHTFGAKAQRLFYLSVPPQVTNSVVEMLGHSGVLKHPNTKLLLEKPFGTDLASAEELVANLKKYCDETQLYRIDHYLAKEMAQNLIMFRGGNSLIKDTWSKDYIESITVYASETIGIEGRAEFYERTGALRDFVQSHLLQLASLVLMDLPDINKWHDIPTHRLQALQALEAPRDIAHDVIRGQYVGYRQEVDNPDSQVETYVSLRVYSRDPRWEGVPITLTTGKALAARTTEIRICYRKGAAAHANELVLRIQPHEGVTLRFWIKHPGYDHEMQPLPLVLAYDNHFSGLPAAYERVFVDAMRSDHTLFTTSDEVLASWRVLAPIQQTWDMNNKELVLYEPGQEPRV